jgi:hypothetical protein
MAERPQSSHRFSVRAVLREAAVDYVSRFGLLLVAALAVFLPVGLIEAAAEELVGALGEHVSPGVITGSVAAALATVLTTTLGGVFYTGVVAGIVSEARGGVRHGLADLARNLPYARLIAIDLLFSLVVAVGVLALVVPGVIVFTWYALAPVVEIEARDVRWAFRRSRGLVRGNFWKVLALLLPVLLVGDLLGEQVTTASLWAFGDGFLSEWMGRVLAEVVTAPFFALAAVVSTHHLIALPRDDPADQRR